jgi:uncharacterized protein with HEPN domain
VKDDRLYLIHIQERIARIEDYTRGGETAFLASDLIQDAVLRNLQTLAESTQRLSDGIRSTREDVDWRRIAGFRNILVHDYLGVDIDHVWGIVANELPMLKVAVADMLRRLEET